MESPSFDLAVIGGGIAGLSLAHHALKQGWQVALLEAQPRLGGAVNTHRKDGEFWLELGAHTLFNSYGTVLDILADVGIASNLLPRRRLSYRMWTERGIASIPTRLHWLELLRGMSRLPRLRKSGATVLDYWGTLVGPRNFQEVVGPALDAVICQPTADVPAEILFRTKPRRRNTPRNFSLPGGLSTFAELVAAHQGLQIHCGSQVLTIERHGSGFAVKSNQQNLTAHRLALAVPPPEAARLLGPLESEAAALLEQIGVVGVESLGVTVREERVSLPPVAGLIGQRQSFYSMVSRDPIADPTWRGFTFHFRPQGPSAAEKRNIAARVLGCAANQFDEVIETTHTLPAPRRGHFELIDKVDGILKNLPIALTGNYLPGLSIEDCASRSRAEALRLSKLSAFKRS